MYYAVWTTYVDSKYRKSRACDEGEITSAHITITKERRY